MAVYAAFFLEWLRIKHRMNPFALRSKLYLKAIRQAFEEIAAAKGRVTSLSKEDDADFLRLSVKAGNESIRRWARNIAGDLSSP